MGIKFTQMERAAMIRTLVDEPLDLLVIGGGVTGAGILLDAQTRGMRVALVEMQDFAAGTSSRSTKLVHGGLRYLKQFDISVVVEVGRERAIVYENAPHVTTPLWMLLPIVEGGTYGKLMSALGLIVYDRLARVKPAERNRMLTKEEALRVEPLLNPTGLKGAGYYVEYRTDDARLTLEILKEAVARGAVALNYAKAEKLVYEQGLVRGATVQDRLRGETITVHAKKVVNATGPWVDRLREMDHSKVGKTLHWTKGVHIVVDGGRFPLRNPVYFDVPDGRMVFAIPRTGKTYVGTTDTNYQGDPERPLASAKDRDYLMNCVNHMFPDVLLCAEDIEALWAGVRPLIHEEGKSPSEISRKDEVLTSPSELITIAGGKLTGYRKMADKVVSHVAALLERDGHAAFPPCQTERMELSGGKFNGSANLAPLIDEQTRAGVALGLTQDAAATLASRYGTNVGEVYAILRDERDAVAASGLAPDVYAALHYGMRREMLATPADFFIRRTAAMFFDVAWVRMWKDPVLRHMAVTLDWSEEQTRAYRDELEARLVEATHVSADELNHPLPNPTKRDNIYNTCQEVRGR